MMREYFPVAASLLFLVVGCHGSGVEIKVVNDSGKKIESVQFSTENVNDQASTLLGALGTLEQGQSETIVITDIQGEGSYITQVTFEDGETMEGDGKYVESGYHVTETIQETEIVLEYDQF